MSNLLAVTTDRFVQSSTSQVSGVKRPRSSDERVGLAASARLVAAGNPAHLWADLWARERPLVGRWSVLPLDARVSIYSFLPPRELLEIHLTGCLNVEPVYQNQLIAKALTRRNSPSCPMTYREYKLAVAFGNAEHLKSIKHLDLSDVGNQMEPSELRTILAKFENLESLNLEGCFAYSRDHFPYLVDYLQRCGSHLKILNLKHAVALQEIDIELAVSSCRNLTHLILEVLFEENSGVVQTIGKHCADLTHLDVWYLPSMEESIRELADGCPKLEHLNIACDKITEASVDILANKFPRLTSLKLWIMDPSGAEILKSQEFNFSKLTDLDLSSSYLTDESLQSVMRHCKNLDSLSVSENDHLTDVGINDAISKCPKLTKLDLGYCRNLTDAGINDATTKCPNLTKLDLACCVNLTDIGVRSVASNCLHLMALNLNGVALTDQTIGFLISMLPNLRHLTITDNSPRPVSIL